MKLKNIVISAFIIFALVLFSVGVCFASPITDFPPAGFVLTSYVPSQVFLKLTRSEVSTDSSNPTWLFNNVYLYLGSSNKVTFCLFDENTSSFTSVQTNGYGWTVASNYLYVFIDGGLGGIDYFFNSDDLPFGNSSPNSYYNWWSSNGQVSVSSVSPSLSSGSSFDIVPASVGEVFDFTLPAGYALVIQGDCEILERNFSISNSWNFSNSDGNRVNGSSERLLAFGNIVDGFSPDKNLSRSALIQWQALNSNIQGTASNYSFNANDLVTVPSGSCFVISYPTLYGFGSSNATITFENSVDLIGNVYLQYSGDRPTVRVVALESLSEYSSIGQFSTYSVFRPAVKNEILSPSGVSDSGHTILTPSTPLPSGGGNSGQPPVDEDNSLLGVLQRLSNQITGLFNSAIDAIHNLVTQGSVFMSNLASMFTWLPQPVYAVLVSAFIVVIIIGVLKLLF